jgi:DNA polymerase I-like protein with 3'-5' exonuclease and polymerase domains
MEYNIDKYSHKLSVKNNISYEIARDIIEKNIEKIEDKFPYSNNVVKKAYINSKNNTLKGGKKKYSFKINYN